MRQHWFQMISKLPFISGMLVLITGLSITLSNHNSDYTTFRLNVMAIRDYPERAIHKQAQQLFEYIFANPRYLMPDTRTNYSRLLMETGQKDKAIRILLHEDKEFNDLDETDPHFSKKMRQLGMQSLLLEKEKQADMLFNHALKADRQQLESELTGDERARILWSIAMTLKARGEPKAAIKTAKEAGENASSSSLRWHIGRWEKSVAR